MHGATKPLAWQCMVPQSPWLGNAWGLLAVHPRLQPLQQRKQKAPKHTLPTHTHTHTHTTLKTLPAQRLHSLSCRGLACMDLDGCNVEAAWRRALVLEKVLQQCRIRELGDKLDASALRDWRGWKNRRVSIAWWHCAKNKHVVKHDVKTIATTSLLSLKLYEWNGSS